MTENFICKCPEGWIIPVTYMCSVCKHSEISVHKGRKILSHCSICGDGVERQYRNKKSICYKCRIGRNKLAALRFKHDG